MCRSLESARAGSIGLRSRLGSKAMIPRRTAQTEAEPLVAMIEKKLAVEQSVIVILARRHHVTELAMTPALDAHAPAGLEDIKSRGRLAGHRILKRRGNGRHAVVAAHGCFISSERTFLVDADRVEGWSSSPVLAERVGAMESTDFISAGNVPRPGQRQVIIHTTPGPGDPR